MTRKKLQIDTRRNPDDWTLDDARAQWKEIQDSMQWRKTYGRPFDAVAIVAESVLIAWEITEKKPTAKRVKEIRKLIVELSARWDMMRTLPISLRSRENQGMLAIVAWAIRMMEEALAVV